MADKEVVTKNAAKITNGTVPPDQALTMKIVAVCWEQFGRGANITINESAFDKAMEIALPNLLERLSKEPTFSPEELEAAKYCSKRAGRAARRIAREEAKNGNSPLVVDTTYQKAWTEIKEELERKNVIRDKDGLVSIDAVYC